MNERYRRLLQTDTAVHGGLPRALTGHLRRAGIVVSVAGDPSAWSRPGTGTLLVGERPGRHETTLLLAVLGDLRRNDVFVVAEGFTAYARVLQGVDLDLVLPVVPPALGSDGAGAVRRRLNQRRLLGAEPTRAQLRAANLSSLERATGHLAAGHVVIAFPGGPVADAPGRVLTGLSVRDREKVLVVPVRFDRFAPTRIARRLQRAGRGVPVRRPMRVTLHVGTPLDASVVVDKPATEREITERLVHG